MSKLIEIEHRLIYIDENNIHRKVQNAFTGHTGFHLCHGWHLYKDPLDLSKEYEIQIIDEETCRIIQEIK